MNRFFVLALFVLSAAFSTENAVGEDRPIASDAKDVKPLKVGDSLPDVTLKDVEGKDVKLSDLHTNGPLVVVFFRGSWCPFCTRHTQELIKAQSAIEELGATLVAVSPDNVENSQGNVDKNAIPFAILSDADVAAAKAFGLAFKVDDATITKYQGFGIDLNKASGNAHHVLPVPAVFIANQSGKLTFVHTDPDYRKRLAVNAILKELRAGRLR